MFQNLEQTLKQNQLDRWITKNKNRMDIRLKTKQISLKEIQEMCKQKKIKSTSKSTSKNTSKSTSKNTSKSTSKNTSKNTSKLDKGDQYILNSLKYKQSLLIEQKRLNKLKYNNDDSDDSDNEPLV
jgi:hypothetical protein